MQILTKDGLTDPIRNTQGVKQGCPLSPSLFNLFIKPLSVYIERAKCSGINMGNGTDDIDTLFFADDIAVISDNVRDLQRKIDALSLFVKDFGLKINLDKSQIMVCRNGGIITKAKKWKLEDKIIRTTSYYKYLGLTFSTRNSWSKGTSVLVDQAKKSFALVKRFLLSAKCEDIHVWFRMFDSVVSPILYYGAEIWGYQIWEKIEQFHLQVCKYILKVGKSTMNSMALGECGRYPLSLRYQKRCIKYYVKILRMDNHRLPKQCFLHSRRLSESGRVTWATHIKAILFHFGFFEVWEARDVGDVKVFLRNFTERMKVQFTQKWEEDIQGSDLACTYRDFKRTFEIESYLLQMKYRSNIEMLVRFRTNRFGLRVDKCKNVNVSDRICKLCNLHNIEDQFHVLGVCSAYNNIRTEQFGQQRLIYNDFVSIMMTNDVNLQRSISKFLREVSKIQQNREG